MTSQNESDQKNIKQGFGKVLNRHGYGFHYSVLKVANELFDQRKSKWIFEAAEFPVHVQGQGTRIDFIMKLSHQLRIYLLSECKRANPALSNWCFARAPYVRRNRTDHEPLFLEYAQPTEEQETIYASAKEVHDFKDKAYHIALEVKSNEKGDSGVGRGAIEAAATQICRGLNGMIEFVSENVSTLANSNGAYFLPVIFTTAKLWVSDIDLSSANVEDGNVDIEDANFNEQQWLFYQYHLSPGIKHSSSPINRPTTIGGFMDSEYIRTIAIVSASGIEPFLQWSSDTDHYLTW